MRRPVLVAAGGVLLVVLAFAAGRWSAPTKVVERSTDTSWMDARTVRTRLADRDERVKTVRHVITVRERKPTGEVLTTRTEDTTTGVDLTVHASDATAAEVHQGEAKTSERIVERERSNLAVEASAVLGLSLPVPLEGWQAQAHVRILGPLWFGGGPARIAGRWYGLATVRLEP